jgi:hypothetical protein
MPLNWNRVQTIASFDFIVDFAFGGFLQIDLKTSGIRRTPLP